MSISSTTINASFNRALKIDQDVLSKIESFILKFYKDAREKVLSETPYTTVEIPDAETAASKAEDADQVRDYAKRRELDSIRDRIMNLDEIFYTVVLSDSTTITDISLQQVLDLSNSPAERISALFVTNKGYSENHFSIKFLESHNSCVEIKCTSDLALARQLKSSIKNELDNATRGWWPLRRGAVVWGSWILFLTLINLNGIRKGIDLIEGESTSLGADQVGGVFLLVFGVIFISGVGGVLLVMAATKLWDWMFPKVEFVWGGGKNLFDFRNKVRSFVFWTVPVTLIGAAFLGAYAGTLLE